jgi:hypothetical protein
MIPEISLILPAYNEARVIPVTISEAVGYFESRGLSVFTTTHWRR